MPPYAIAIETSSRDAQVALGCGETVLATATLSQQRRHNLELVSAIDELCTRHGLKPADLAACFVALGPGSFTGLRIGVATAKTLALALNLELVGVPSLDVLAANAPLERPAAVCLNTKAHRLPAMGHTTYCAIYCQTELVLEPALRTLDDLATAAPPDTVHLGGSLPDHLPQLPAELTIPQAENVYHLALRRPPTAATVLQPLYIREPEAVTLWNQRHGPDESDQLAPGQRPGAQ